MSKFWILNQDGSRIPNEDEMVIEFLSKGILFINSRQFIETDGKTICPETLVLFVNCNDLFCWGCADSCELTLNELPELFNLYEIDPNNAVEYWVCKKRNMQPQKPYKDLLFKTMSIEWQNVISQLPPNPTD